MAKPRSDATPRRLFLGWEQPLLQSVVQHWADRGDGREHWDLSAIRAIVPVKRAGRRLNELVQEFARGQGWSVRPPQIHSVGQLPELLYKPSRRLASEMEQTLAWTQVLKNIPEDQLRPLVPVPPRRRDPDAWVDLASLLRRLTEDLASDGLSARDVIEHVRLASEQRRWELISQLYEQYLKVLNRAEISDPYEERREAVRRGVCQSDRPIELIGCVDLGEQVCKMLTAVAPHVTAIIAAPEAQSQLFDPLGRVLPSAWSDYEVRYDDNCLVASGDAPQQCRTMASHAQQWSEASSDHRLTIGITDDGFAPLVETELDLAGYRAFRVAGVPVTRTSPGRLLALMQEHLQIGSWGTLAALVRHADVLEHFVPLENHLQVLTELDQLRAEHFPLAVDQPLPKRTLAVDKQGRGNFTQAIGLAEAITNWLNPLCEGTARLADHCHALRRILTTIHRQLAADSDAIDEDAIEKDASESAETPWGDTESLDDERVHSAALERIDQLLEHFTAIPEALDIQLNASAALDAVLQRLAEPHAVAVVDPDQRTPICGWLDLALDDTPAMIVVGFNHPFVPQSVTADPFLPGNLRSTLRMMDNQRRFARDAYVLQLIVASRPQCLLITGRFGPDGSPTPPSRLLAAAAAETTARRVARLLGGQPNEGQPNTRWDRDQQPTHLPVPQAAACDPPSSVSVTAFRDYLTCPFRFYLRHLLKMRPLDDAGAELAANQFGNLVHEALERFGQSDRKNLSDAAKIEREVTDHLWQFAEEMYGQRLPAAVRVQIEQAQRRLTVFAELQAARRQEGWLVHSSEDAVHERSGAGIELEDGRKLVLKGRVDRIDYHPDDDRWTILDYKTHGHDPRSKHFDKARDQWIDLQLPLYLFMLKPLGIEAPTERVQLGYFNLADKAAESGVHLTEFTPAEIGKAMEEARRVAKGILDGDFQPQTDPTRVPYDDYGMILQTGIAESLTDDITE